MPIGPTAAKLPTNPTQDGIVLMNIKLLKALCETPGAPGHEHRVRALIEKEIKGMFDHVETDAMGSLLCRKDPTKKAKGKAKKVMLLSPK